VSQWRTNPQLREAQSESTVHNFFLFVDYFYDNFTAGIAGIEKKLQQKNEADIKNISKAFQDLDR
jgi:hypothetical protein